MSPVVLALFSILFTTAHTGNRKQLASVLKGKLPTVQNKCSVLKFLFLFLDLGVVIHNPWLQIPPLFFFCG